MVFFVYGLDADFIHCEEDVMGRKEGEESKSDLDTLEDFLL